jgi:phospholipase C
MQDCIDGGAMDGFVKNADSTTSSNGRLALSVNDATDLPFNYWLASTFSIADAYAYAFSRQVLTSFHAHESDSRRPGIRDTRLPDIDEQTC